MRRLGAASGTRTPDQMCGAHSGGSAPAARRAKALALVTEQFRLSELIATYAKPVVVSLHGKARGAAAWALAQNAQYGYCTETSEIALPEASAGIVPLGGASYHLARLGDGVGLYLALTGAALHSAEAYWAGAAPLFGSVQDLRANMPRELGLAAGDENSALDLHGDPTYTRALRVLRDFRADGKLGWVTSNLGEDVSREIFDEYVRLKRWYSYWVAGDRTSAELARSEDRLVAEEGGDLFDFHEGAEVHGGRGLGAGYGDEHPGSFAREPRRAAAERRARAGALSAHAAALFRRGAVASGADDGPLGGVAAAASGGSGAALGAGPSAELAQRLQLIRRCFATGAGAAGTTGASAASPGRRAPAQVASPPRPAAAAATTALSPPLARDWESRLLATPVDAHVAAARAHCELDRDDLNADALRLGGVAAGSASAADWAEQQALQLRVMSDAVREAVAASWPTGRLADDKVRATVERFFGAPRAPEGASEAAVDAAEASHRGLAILLRVSTGRVVSDLLRLPSPYALTDSALVTAARRLYRRPLLPAAASVGGGPVGGVAAGPLGSGRTALQSIALAPFIEGPSGFTIPVVEDAVSIGETGAHAPGGLVPINPRIHSDPDGLFYDFREGEDSWWSFTRGRWRGDLAGSGATDVIPITLQLQPQPQARPATAPGGGGGATPLPAPLSLVEGAAAAVGALRADVLRLLSVAGAGSPRGGGVEGVALGAYAAEAALRARVCARAAAGDASAAVEEVLARQQLLGVEGLRAVAARSDQLRRAEAGSGAATALDSGANEFDIAVPGDLARRASAFVAWPHLTALLHRMRVLVYSGLARHAFGAQEGGGGPSAQDISELADFGPDAPWGFAELASAAAASSASSASSAAVAQPSLPALAQAAVAAAAATSAGAVEGGTGAAGRRGDARKLLNTWLSILYGSGGAESSATLPDPSGRAAGGLAAGTGGGRAPAAAAAPAADLTAAQRAELREAALLFARWEAVAIGSAAGGPLLSSSSSSSFSAAATVSAAPARGAPPQAVVGQQQQQQASFARFSGLGRGGGGGGGGGVDAISPTSPMSSASPSAASAASSSATFSLEPSPSGGGGARSSSYPPSDEAPIEEGGAGGADGGAAGSAAAIVRALEGGDLASIVSLFALPATGNTLASAALAAAHLVPTAAAGGVPGSIAAIRARLEAEITAADASGSASLASFARATLRQLEAASPRALDATLALVAGAGSLSLSDAMCAEFQAVSRLLGGSGEEKLELGARGARVAAEARRRVREQDAWTSAHEVFLAGGEGSGAFGDLFRRRYCEHPPAPQLHKTTVSKHPTHSPHTASLFSTPPPPPTHPPFF